MDKKRRGDRRVPCNTPCSWYGACRDELTLVGSLILANRPHFVCREFIYLIAGDPDLSGRATDLVINLSSCYPRL